MKTGKLGIELIKKFEGFRANPYLCPAGVPTIGYGITKYIDGVFVSLEDRPITRIEGEKMLIIKLSEYEEIVKRNIRIKLTQNQFDALVSHTYNSGGSKTLFKYVNEQDERLSLWWLNHYITANGKALGGLKIRRGEELELFYKNA